MEKWEVLFEAIYNLVRSAPGFTAGVRRAIAFALETPRWFDAPFWNELADRWQLASADRMAEWARTGLQLLGPGAGSEFLLRSKHHQCILNGFPDDSGIRSGRLESWM